VLRLHRIRERDQPTFDRVHDRDASTFDRTRDARDRDGDPVDMRKSFASFLLD